MVERKRDQCFMCSSRTCETRIVCRDAGYDEVACLEHAGDLGSNADKVAPGYKMRNISSSSKLRRGETWEEIMG